MTLPNDIHRCLGVGDDTDGWRDGCEDCQRRTSSRPNPCWWMTPPAVIVFECESRIAPECTCAAKDMTFGRCCKLTPNKCKWCGHDIHAHDKQYGCAEDGCDCETPNAALTGHRPKE